MKKHIFRVVYLGICLLAVYLSCIYYEEIVSDNSRLETFSYIGTVVTAVGFIVTIFEVLHSVYVSKSISKQSKELLERVKDVENASSISDCISAVDETNRHVMNEDYSASLCGFQNLRKLLVKLNIESFQDKELLNSVERLIFKSTKTTAKAPLSKPQKDNLINDIMAIKVALEESSPVNRGK